MTFPDNNPIKSTSGRFWVFLFGFLHKGFSQAVKRLSWDQEQMKAYELKRLQNIVTYAHEHSPMYRKLYDNARVHPSQLKTLQDIQKFPVLTKELLKQALTNGTIFTEPVMPAGTIS